MGIPGALLWGLVVGLTTASHPISQDLGSSVWYVENANSSIKMKATVPGGIYTDLSSAGVLTEDLLYRFNDIEYRWVARDNWTYSTTFNVSPKILKKSNIFLEFEGLDTIAKVLINSNLLGETKNMFVLYNFNVKPFLQRTNNLLEVRFTSPILAAEEASTQTSYLVPPACVPDKYNGECHVNYLRKMQASFAWDWGPAFPSQGIWKPVRLRGYDKAYARHVGVETRPETDDWKVSATLYMDVPAQVSGTLRTVLYLSQTENVTSEMTVTATPQQNNPSLVFSVSKESVEMWWPNGHGSQPLYNLTVSFLVDGGDEVTSQTVRIGFRTIKLVQIEAVPSDPDKGLTFFFRVNGEPIFAKGSNYIPADILPERGAEPQRLRHILSSAVRANMNMLRVWGGGIYESDLFYQMCDELGLLVWQDMMFACSMYPATDEFLSNVVTEVTQQLQRLQHHASIAVWAGNNENEAALAGNWYNTQQNFSLFKADYIKLYVDTIRPIVYRLDKTRSYVVSSPSNGLESEKEGFVAKNPYDPKYGDVHWYDYILNLWNSPVIIKTRFGSEYGIQSLPSFDSLANVSLPTDLALGTEFMKKRQHHPGGYAQITHEIKNNMYMPDNVDLETYIYLSQINQAMSMKVETESYRRGRGQLDSAGLGLTMGALYWQLNDVWQAPSWSSMELNGKWKMLHYYAVDFFSPILVSPSVDVTKVLRVHLISDLKMYSSFELTLQISIYNWHSLNPVNTTYEKFTTPGAGVVEVISLNIDMVLQNVDGCKTGGRPQENCFFQFSVYSANSSTPVGPDNYYFPIAFHSINAPPLANIELIGIKPLMDNKELILTLRTNSIALFVWLDSPLVKGHFSHNGFQMVSNQTQLTFTSEQPIDVNLFKTSLKIRSLKFKS